MKVYCISGLGADRRVFYHLSLPAPHQMVPLDWIAPLKGESLQRYALRLAEKMDLTQPFALLGLSMGGMIASEIAYRYPPQKLILISSIAASGQLPFYYRAAGRLRLHRLVGPKLFKQAARLKRLFTAESTSDKKLLRQIIGDTDPAFIDWAMEAILGWKTTQQPTGYIHIHGSRDGILPLRFTRPTHVIKGAGHMMVMQNATQINQILARELAPSPETARPTGG